MKMAPVVSELANELKEGAVVGSVNVQRAPLLADRFRIEYIPTFIFVKNGEETGRVSGIVSKKALLSELKKHL